MLLVTLVVTQNINPIEVRLINSVWLIGTALLENQPATRLLFLRRILRSLFPVAIEPLPANKLASRAIKNNVAWHRKPDLLAVNPTRRRGRRISRKSHFVPELIRFILFFIFVFPLCRTSAALLCAAGLRRNVSLDRFRRLRLRHTLPANDLETRSTVESHHDVFITTAIRRESQVGTRAKLARRLGRNIFVFGS